MRILGNLLNVYPLFPLTINFEKLKNSLCYLQYERNFSADMSEDPITFKIYDGIILIKFKIIFLISQD
jgi:hypothetical protein